MALIGDKGRMESRVTLALGRRECPAGQFGGRLLGFRAGHSQQDHRGMEDSTLQRHEERDAAEWRHAERAETAEGRRCNRGWPRFDPRHERTAESHVCVGEGSGAAPTDAWRIRG